MKELKNKDLRLVVEKKLLQLLVGLKISKPSAKVKNLLKKIAKRLTKQIKGDLKKLAKQKSKGTKNPKKAVKVKP